MNWATEFPSAITVCDKEGIILWMNEQAIASFEESGGEKLIGANVLDCHPEPSKSQLKQLLLFGEKNVYTIEKKGIKKLIFQSPWYENGTYMGFVEISHEIPFEMNHFIRKS